MVLASLYDDWLKSISSFTAFSRLVLILRALHVNNEKAKIILRPTKTTITQPHHVWPSLSDDEWVSVEVALKELILADYAKRNSVNTASLTSSETRDIILGMEIQAPSVQRQQMTEIEQSTADAQVTALQVQTTNVHGDQIITTTTTNYEQQTFASKSDWRIRAISATNIPLRLAHTYVTNDDIKEDLPTYVLAKNVLKNFIVAADLRASIVGWMYGRIPEDNKRVVEVQAIVLVPQKAGQRTVEMPEELPEHNVLSGLKLVGLIKTQPQETQQLSVTDAITFARLVAKHDELDQQSVLLSVAFAPGSLSLSAYALTAKGFDTLRNMDINNPTGAYNPATATDRAQLLLSDRIAGSMLAPVGGAWNYSLSLASAFSSTMQYQVDLVGQPESFWAIMHRTQHFFNFGETTGNDAGGDLDDNFA